MICRYRIGVDIVGPDSQGKFREKYRFCLGGLLIWFLDNFTDYYSSRCTTIDKEEEEEKTHLFDTDPQYTDHDWIDWSKKP